jgi:ABC-2 type transport system ATP-binding protein
MQQILSTNNLTKKYGSVQALDGLTINIHKGDVYGILGPNGSGKTTTLGIVLGVTNATSGSYAWFGEGSDHNLRKKIGAFLDKPNFYPHLTAIQNLKLSADIKDLKNPRIGEAMDICGVNKFANRKFITYSTGMKQRLAIASTMLGTPEVLVLDEPTNGLDPEGIADVRAIITRIANEGITVLMASHLLDEVQKVCSHVGVLKAGKKLYEGHVQSLVAGSDGIEIGSDDLGKLQKVLTDYDGIHRFEKKGEVIFVQLKAGYRSAELSGYLITKGVDITHFAHKKGNLEEEFLHLLSGNGH